MSKLIIAIIQEDDFEAVVNALNSEGFFVTQLSSSGGFLRRKNYTIMVGVSNEEQEKVISILRENASKRKQIIRKVPVPVVGARRFAEGTVVPIEIDVGGVTVFIIPMDSIQKF